MGPDIKCFVIPPNSKLEKTAKKSFANDASWLTNLPQFQGAQPDHGQVESSRCVPTMGVSVFCSR